MSHTSHPVAIPLDQRERVLALSCSAVHPLEKT